MSSALDRQSAAHAVNEKDELFGLRELAGRAGKDPLLTQGSSGNCSLKTGGILWIKASGKWMADAMSGDFLLPISLSAVNQAMCRGMEPADSFPGASLETALHATIPHRIVLHVHSVNAIGWAVRTDAAGKLSALLNDLPWVWIPYTPSGLPLANAVREALGRQPDAQVFILGNHGLVIAADDQDRLEEILARAEKRLALEARSCPKSDLERLSKLCRGTGWSVPREEHLHSLGKDLITREILARGLLVPSQAFLSDGHNADLFRPVPHVCRETLKDSASEARPFLILEDQGILVRQNVPRGDIELLRGLVEVARRIPARAIRYLTQPEIRELHTPLYQQYRERASSGRGLA